MLRIVGLFLAACLLAAAIPALADEDVAQHKHTSDSSQYDQSPDSLVVDGDSTSCYDSGRGAPVWVEIDLGAEYPLKLIRLIPSMAPDGLVNIIITGRTAAGVTYTLATYSGTAHEHQAINIPILVQIPVEFVRVSTLGSCSIVKFYTIQCIKATGTTPVLRQSTWGSMKALYK